MADSTPLFSFDRFSGMNNVEASFRIPVTTDKGWHKLYDMGEIENLDIDNSYLLSTRPGSDQKLSSADIHSLWSDGNIICLFVDSPILYKLNPGYVTPISTALGTVGSGRMSYTQWNDRVYLTNESFIGYIHDDTLTSLVTPNLNYKLPLPAGKFIAYFQGKLYVAKGNVLYVSDALCDHYDIRTGYRTFTNNITMLRPVNDGIYVADGKTWFLYEKRMFVGDPAEFKRDMVLDKDAIPFTDVSINGSFIGEGIEGDVAIWTSTDGICLGDNMGKVKNLTRSRYSMSPYGIGGSVVRNLNGTVHYITVLQ